MPDSGVRRAAWSLGLGLVGLALCGALVFALPGSVWDLLVALPAIVVGHQALGRLRPKSHAEARGRAIAGLALGYGTVVARIMVLVIWHI